MSRLASPATAHSTDPHLSAPSRRAARVLVVEADATVAGICRKALQHERLEVRHVASPLAAWEQLHAWRPQFLLIGDEFDDCSGLELVGQMRSKTNAPIVMVSASDCVGYLANCLEAGADDVLVRPLSPPLLLGKCQAQLRRAYRYSVLPLSPKPAQNQAPVSPAPVVPEATAPMSNFSSWPQCEGCGYLGPPTRFKKHDSHGSPLSLCPACGGSSIRLPLG